MPSLSKFKAMASIGGECERQGRHGRKFKTSAVTEFESCKPPAHFRLRIWCNIGVRSIS
jgi:hypothetical protein